MEISRNYILVKKPSFFLYLTALICFSILFLIGNPVWRHIDDYKPLEVLFNAESIKDYFKLFSYWGWGSYPPIWQYFSFASYIFNPLGIDIVRIICFILGSISLLISSILTFSICSILKQENIKKINPLFDNYFLEFLCVLLNLFNPEIILHSNSNMPYNLSTITLQLIIILIFNIINNNNKIIEKNKYININSNYFKIICLFSIVLTFQSSIIIFAFFITMIIYYFNFKKNFKLNIIFKTLFKSIVSLNLFKNIENKFLKYSLILFLSFLLIMYFFKFCIIIFYKNMTPGIWANGIDDIYNISFKLNNLLELLHKVFFSFRAIITQSLYPIRNGQIQSSIFLTIFFVYCNFKLNVKNLLCKYFSIFSIFTILTSLFLAIIGNFIFAPTRHTIFIYPIIWIPIILTLDNYFLKFKFRAAPIYFSFALFLFLSLGCFISIKEISYSNNENNMLLKLLKEADFNFTNSYEPFSNISLNGSEEFKLTNNKICSKEKIENLNSYTVFLYSHREPFYNNQRQLDYLSQENKECFKKDFEISILDKIEINNKKDIEQNNLIENGGSNLYGYLVKIIKVN